MPRPHVPPPWWPQGEPWPPRTFGAEQWRSVGRRFFWRVALGFGLLFALAVALGTFALWFLSADGMWDMHERPPMFMPSGGPRPAVATFGWVIIPLGVLAVWRAAVMLRRSLAPMRELIDAVARVQGGDYAARVNVPVRAPPESRALARAFNDMAARLQQNEESRRNLLADVTHELRTPLTVIQGTVEGLLDGVYARDDAHIAPVLEETRVLARLIDDLRTLALAESGALKLEREPLDIAHLARDATAAYAAQAQAKAVTLSAKGDAVTVDADPVRLREVIANLVANALRHTPAGGSVAVEVSTMPAAARVVVRDSGSGIPADLLPRVFDRFAKDRESPGSGLGLAIARQLVEAHGGSIRAESAPGQGALFTIELPRYLA